MESIFELFLYLVFGPATLFTGSPLGGLLMVIGFAILLMASIVRTQAIKTWTHFLLLVTMGLWVLQSLWEIHAQSQGWNIRVDIMFWWPVLMPFTLAAVLCAGRDLFTSPPVCTKNDNA